MELVKFIPMGKDRKRIITVHKMKMDTILRCSVRFITTKFPLIKYKWDYKEKITRIITKIEPSKMETP